MATCQNQMITQTEVCESCSHLIEIRKLIKIQHKYTCPTTDNVVLADAFRRHLDILHKECLKNDELTKLHVARNTRHVTWA